jgi:hypothetical protein
MLVDYQRALAALVASPGLCRQARCDPQILADRFTLTPREWRRLVGIVCSAGMEANCMLYRANRLAPVALNLPETCSALADDLAPLLSAYWDSEPTTNVHFLVEADRFCQFLRGHGPLSEAVERALQHEHRLLAARLALSRERAELTSPRRVSV